jgi:hypothetical protein
VDTHAGPDAYAQAVGVPIFLGWWTASVFSSRSKTRCRCWWWKRNQPPAPRDRESIQRGNFHAPTY